ncbi:MAG TPA: hypothetical protein VFO83_05690, partial [Aggregicoccus sp.]|nr:hypothetical protein [Aggregicoccus sp.]
MRHPLPLLLALLLLSACGGAADPCASACEGVDCKPAASSCVLSLRAEPSCEDVPEGGACSSSVALLRCVDGQRVEEACAPGSACGLTQGLAGCRASACTEGSLRCGAQGLERCGAGAWVREPCAEECRGDLLLGACGDAAARLSGTVRYARRGPTQDYSDWGPVEWVPARGFLVASYRGSTLVDLQVTDGS